MSGHESSTIDSNFSFSTRSETVLSLALLAVLVVLLVPLPPMLLDLLLAVNISSTILLLLVTLGVTQPLDLAVFPSLLLLITLFRLSLNVATTRLILLGGDAGRIVETFGNFVVGGNLVVGLVIFLILVVIQFIVITKGAGRVSEVAARFTLESLPGKQMSIDAELGAGTINEKEARTRRAALTREAEFFGAMDGASKFVRGDAVAGLVVTAINLVGGVILGVINGYTLAAAVQHYSILTIGDGLVSQIPALIIATASGVLVTKAGSQVSLGREIGTQLLQNRQPLWMGAIILGGLALAPGLPKLPFLAIAGGLYYAVRQLDKQAQKTKELAKVPSPAETPVKKEEDVYGEFLETDRASVEVGARLISIVDSKRSKGLTDRIRSLRRDMNKKYGLWIPTVRVRDNLQLPADTYRVMISGREVARGVIQPENFLAIDPPAGEHRVEIAGDATKEPTFGLPARWITEGNRARAELCGYTVVDACGVVITHLGEILRRHAAELLSRDDLQKLLDQLKETSPALLDEMKPDTLRVGLLHQVLIKLLEEQLPINDLARILEAVLNHSATTKEPNALADLVRRHLGRTICDRFRDKQGRVRVIVLEPRVETALRDSLRDHELSLAPPVYERLIQALSQQWQTANAKNMDVALLTDQNLRRPLRRSIERAIPELPVIAYQEIPKDLQIDPASMIRPEDVFPGHAHAGSANTAPPRNTLELERELNAA